MTILENYKEIQDHIDRSLKYAHRKNESISLIAVTKTFEQESILPLLEAGHRIFGENKVQEAYSKWLGLKTLYPDVCLHLIGTLQTNKVKEAVALFDSIDSLDNLKLATKLKQEMVLQNRTIPCFVQVNIGSEPQKSGVLPQETATFVHQCQELGLEIKGVMCIPPVNDESAPYFAFLKKLACQAGVAELNMGMSDDYKIALQQGATTIRVGSALFGSRG